jgi:excisionase family DNA binding protein
MTDEMYTTKQAALYLGVTEADIRLAVREGKLRAWTLPMQRGLLVRKADLLRFREAGGRSSLTRQLSLFAADGREAASTPQANGSETSAA